MLDRGAQARRRAKRLEDRVRGENERWFATSCPTDKHGTLTGATYWGCQCDPCTNAIAKRREEREAERAHNDAIIARLAGEPTATTLPPPQTQGRPIPEQGGSAPQRNCDPVAGRVEQDGDGVGEPAAPSQALHRLVETPADPPAPGLLNGLAVPQMVPAVRAKIRGVEHLSRIVQTYHSPGITAPLPLGGQYRIGNGVVLAVDMAGVVQGLDAHERAEGDSTLMKDPAPVRRYGKRGPTGRRNPTSWDEIKERLRKLGCTVDPGTNHLKVQLPDGRVTTLPSSPSDWRSLPNCVSQLRKLGLDVRRPA